MSFSYNFPLILGVAVNLDCKGTVTQDFEPLWCFTPGGNDFISYQFSVAETNVPT